MITSGVGSAYFTSPNLNFDFSILPSVNIRVRTPPVNPRVTRAGSAMLGLSAPGFHVTSTTRTLSFSKMSLITASDIFAGFRRATFFFAIIIAFMFVIEPRFDRDSFKA